MSFVGTGNNTNHWSEKSAKDFLKNVGFSHDDVIILTAKTAIRVAAITQSYIIGGGSLDNEKRKFLLKW